MANHEQGGWDPTIDLINQHSDEPSVKQIGNIFLVGTNHQTDFNTMPIPPEFVQAVNTADHLIIEGDEWVYQRDMSNFEAVAHLAFKATGRESIHYLDKGSDHDRLKIDAGVDPESVLLDNAHTYLLKGILQRGWVEDREKMERDIASVASGMKQTSSLAADMTDAQLQAQLCSWTDQMAASFRPDNKNILFDIGAVGTTAVTKYGVQVRDTKLYVPQVAELEKKLVGSKLIVVGKDHIPAVERHVRGEPPQPLPSWSEYVKGLHPEQRRGVEAFTQLAKPLRTSFPLDVVYTATEPFSKGKTVDFSTPNRTKRITAEVPRGPRFTK